MALVARHHVHLVRELHLGLLLNDPLAEKCRHPLDIVRIKVEFLSDLFVGEIQTQEVQHQNPGSQRLVMSGEDGVGQVVEAAVTGSAFVPLSLRLGVVPALLDDLGAIAVGTADDFGPAKLADHLVALGVVGDLQDVDEHDGHSRAHDH
jgi:hypothetical protein